MTTRLFLLLLASSNWKSASAFYSSLQSPFLRSALIVSGATTNGATTTTTTTFETTSVADLEEEDDDDNDPSNPMWPKGVSSDDLDLLVDDILADKSINLPQLPDFLERQIYRTTTLLTLNALYRLLGNIHGRTLWGHSFELNRITCDRLFEKLRKESLEVMKSDVDEKLLEEVADQMLANQAINQPLVPDVVERQLYVNCLKIIFRILNMLAASFKITLCGHDLTLQLEKATNLKKVALEVAASQTTVDTKMLEEIARANVYRESSNATNTTKDGLWKRNQRELVVQVNAVLYSLILGILDDLLANTQLEIMTDRITFDIVPPENGDKIGAKGRGKQRRKRKQVVIVKKEKPSRIRSTVTFVLGAVFGILANRILV